MCVFVCNCGREIVEPEELRRRARTHKKGNAQTERSTYEACKIDIIISVLTVTRDFCAMGRDYDEQRKNRLVA
jgi:hypothetical protein